MHAGLCPQLETRVGRTTVVRVDSGPDWDRTGGNVNRPGAAPVRRAPESERRASNRIGRAAACVGRGAASTGRGRCCRVRLPLRAVARRTNPARHTLEPVRPPYEGGEGPRRTDETATR